MSTSSVSFSSVYRSLFKRRGAALLVTEAQRKKSAQSALTVLQMCDEETLMLSRNIIISG